MANKTFRWFDLSKYGKKIVLAKSNNEKKLIIVGKIEPDELNKFIQLGFTQTISGTLENKDLISQEEILPVLQSIYPDVKLMETGDKCFDGSDMQRSRFYINLDKEDVRLEFNTDVEDLKMQTSQAESEAVMESEEVFEEILPEEAPIQNVEPVITSPVIDVNNSELYKKVEEEIKNNRGCVSPETAEEIRSAGHNILKNIPESVAKRTDMKEIIDVDGIRFGLGFKYQNGEVPVVLETPMMYGPKLLRGKTIDEKMHLFQDFTKILEASPIRGHEFRNFVRVINGLNDSDGIPDNILTESRILMNASINRSVLTGLPKTIDKWRKLTRLTENNASQAIIPPTLPMAIIRALGIEQYPVESRSIYVEGDTFGVMATTPESLTRGISITTQTTATHTPVIKRVYREAGLDDAKFTEDKNPGKQHIQIILDKTSVDDIERTLESRPDDGRSMFILPAGSMTPDEINELGKQYRIDSLIDINLPMPGAESRTYQSTILAIGKRLPEIRNENAMEFLDRRVLNNTGALWTWGASVVASRGVSTDNDDVEEDNDYQTPYSPMSQLHESATMVPKNILSPTLEAQQKILKYASGDVDHLVSDALGKTKEELASFLSSEQIDGIATGLYRASRARKDGDAVLIADDTGIGKGRECCALGYSMVRRGERLVYMTEYGSSFSDVWREFRTIGASDDIKPFILNNERIYAETGEILMEPTPRHIIVGATSRSHWPNGQPMQFYVLNRKEASRLRKHTHDVLSHKDVHTQEEIDQATFLKTVLRGRQITLLGDEVLPEVVDVTEIQKEWVESPEYNALFTSYSQINKASIQNQKKKRTPIRNDKTQFLMDLFENQTPENPISVVLDESQNAASNTSNMGKNVQVLVDNAKSLVYASATWSKGVRSLAIYGRLFSQFMNIGQISEIMNEGGATIQETLTRLMVSEAAYVRRELDSSRCEFTNVLGENYKERNIAIVDAVAPILSSIAVMGGQIDARISLLNRAREAEREILEREEGVPVNTNFFSTSPFGTSLSQFARILTRSMSLDIVVDESFRALEEGHKPVIALESTLERFVQRVKAGKEDPTYIPDIKDYLKHVLDASVKIKTPDGQKISIVEEDRERDILDEIIDKFVTRLPECITQVNDESISLDDKEYEIIRFLENNNAYDIRSYVLNSLDAVIAEHIGEIYEREHETLTDDALTRIWQMATDEMTHCNFDVNNPVEFAKSVNNIKETLPMNPAKIYKEILKMIENVPDLPVSAIDYIKHKLTAQGYRVGEITGRATEIDAGGRLVPRHKEPKGVLKDRFNRGELDALIAGINASTAIDLHAGSRFVDQRMREMIFAEDLRDPTKDKQMRGRINRFDQVLHPRFVTCMTGMPVEIRRFIMQNSKSRSLSASVTANRENAHLQHQIPDIINKVGDIVAARFLLGNEDIGELLGMKHVIENLKGQEQKMQEEALELGHHDATIKGDINQLIARIESLLPYHEQIKAMKELEDEYNALIEELNAEGANPLLVKHIAGEWSCRPDDRRLIMGMESDDENITVQESIMSQPLYMEKGKFTRRMIKNSLRSSKLMAIVERNIQYLDDETPNMRAKQLWDLRNTIMQHELPLGYKGNVEDLINGTIEENGIASEILKQKYRRFMSLHNMLSDIQIGSLLTIKEGIDSKEKIAMITDIHMPEITDKKIDMASFYELDYVVVGDESKRSIRLSSIANQTETLKIDIKKNTGFNSNNPEEFMEEWDEETKKAAFNSTTFSRLLIGNEWQAVSMMVSGKFGRVITYDTPDGIQRAIEVLNTEKFDKMPLYLESSDLAFAALKDIKRIEIGDILMTKGKNADTVVRISIPSPSGKASWINENTNVKNMVMDIIQANFPDKNQEEVEDVWLKSLISKNRIILGNIPETRASEFINLLMTEGTQCTVENSFADRVNELRNVLLHGDNDNQVVEEEELDQPIVAPAIGM